MSVDGGEAGHADLDALASDVADALVVGSEPVGAVATAGGAVAEGLVDGVGVRGPEADTAE